MNQEEKVRRLQEATRILENPLFKEACEHIESECWRLFKEVKPQDADALHEIKATHYALTKMLAFFRQTIANGAVEKMMLEDKRPRPAGY